MTIFSAALLLVAIFAPPALACSLFSLNCEGAAVCGRNLDLPGPFPGAVVVNPRGVEKTVLPWSGHFPAPYDGDPVSWVARFGSVTFTCYGRDFIESGMNEAGLVVGEASLGADYPSEDDRPGVSCAQWMQYQLDNYATVEEVLVHLGDLRPDGEGWHYLMIDAGGDCAVVEYEDGRPLVYSHDALEIRALTNTTYGQALSHVPMDAAFGGDIDVAAGGDSYGRFVRMAALMLEYEQDPDGPPTERAFEILDAVGCDETVRSVVYDTDGLRVSWKTPGNPGVRWLDLGELDLGVGAPVRTLDVEIGGPGDASALFSDYSIDANRAIVSAVKGAVDRSSETVGELELRGFTYEEALELIAMHPTSTGGHR